MYRRYNDFVVFHELLLHKFPYRMVPALPPKRMLGGTAGLLEVGEGQRLGVPGSGMATGLQCQPLGYPGSQLCLSTQAWCGDGDVSRYP